jgi:L-ribulose-5-phosphate 3-epimerase
MAISRRTFLTVSTLSLAGCAGVGVLPVSAKAKTPRLRIGICDWSIKAKGRETLEKAASIGLDGVQISPQKATEKLSYATKEEQEMYRQAVKDTGVQIASVGLNVTNKYPLATDPRGTDWLFQTVDAAAALGCTSTLIAFFGKGALNDGKTKKLKKAEIDSVVGKLKEAAPYAKKKGVYLGLENTLSAKDNIAIMDRVGSDAVQVYYDIANSTGNGYDVPAEIRMLKGRICEFHFKNTKGLFGESGVDCVPIAEAINEINYSGWLVLERHFGDDMLGYYKQNAKYVRELFQI